jgi:hypothetical protein
MSLHETDWTVDAGGKQFAKDINSAASQNTATALRNRLH